MENQLNGKIALVTGGSRGLGKNEALAIAAQGGDLVITYRSKEAEAQEAVRTGAINNAMSVIALQWLALNKQVLLQNWA